MAFLSFGAEETKGMWCNEFHCLTSPNKQLIRLALVRLGRSCLSPQIKSRRNRRQGRDCRNGIGYMVSQFRHIVWIQLDRAHFLEIARPICCEKSCFEI